MAKKRGVPEVLWRVYRDRARTLADTIISLLPSSSSSSSSEECRCGGRRCLGCSGLDANAFLLRTGDPLDYVVLLTNCFVVVSENAPSLSFFDPDCRWSQQEIVMRTIEMMISDPREPTNEICSGFSKLERSSCVMDLLTTTAWSLLLTRIGDDAMVHLLTFGSIFLPVPGKNHYQVAGAPISQLCPKILNWESGPSKKRKRTAILETSEVDTISGQRCSSSLGSCSPIVSVARHVDSNQGRNTRPLLSQLSGKHSVNISSEMKVLKTCTSVDSDQEKSKVVLQPSSSKCKEKSKKRVRPFSWERRRKRRQMSLSGPNALISCTNNQNYKENFTGTLEEKITPTSLTYTEGVELSCLDPKKQQPVCNHSKKCFCYLVLEAPQKVGRGTNIDRKLMFYNSNSSSSLFPRNHILMKLKANDTDAVVLMKDIFGLSDGSLTYYIPCSRSHSSSFSGCACLQENFKSLRQLLKNLIRRARGCQYMKLLDKHCVVPAVSPVSMGEAEAIVEGDELQEKLLDSGDNIKGECSLPADTFHGSPNRFQGKQHRSTPSTCTHKLELNGSYCQKSQVISFVWAVCRSIVPQELLGAPSQWRSLRRNISKFIRLRKYEKFSLKQCVHGLETSCFSLISDNHSTCCLENCVEAVSLRKDEEMLRGSNKIRNAKLILKNKLFTCWMYWFFSWLVVPILQANFYITESEVGRLDIFYYRKPIWKNLTSVAVTHLRERNYRLLDGKQLRRILSKRSFGFSKVRFCPKGSGVRPLANMSAPSRISVQESLPRARLSVKDHFGMPKSIEKFDNYKPVNNVLRDLGAVLKEMKMNHPERLGSSVFDYNDVYRKLAPFVIGLKNRFKSKPSAFVVICDVSKAFDCIDQNQLLMVMKEVIVKDEYLLKWSSQVVCTKKSMWVHRNQMLVGQSSKTCSTQSTASVPFRSLHRVITNQETSRKVMKEKLYRDLAEHIKRNVLQVGHNYYLQEVGIPQGSILSSFLCSFYFAHLEAKLIFPFLQKIHESSYSEDAEVELEESYTCENNEAENSVLNRTTASPSNHILLRFTDDFLFISPSKKVAASFFSRLQRGFREYNCFMNEAKSCTNFSMGINSRVSANRIYTGEDGISFLPWSGLLLNCCTMEIQADYTRYLGIHMNSTLTVCWQDKPGFRLKEKLRHYMRIKCHPIFYDSNINSAPTVRLNIYQGFLLCAMKFHCYVSSLSDILTFQPEYYSEMIISSLRYLYKLIVKKMRSRNHGYEVCPILKLKGEEVKWLGLSAYIRVLNKKQSRHTDLLSLLRSELLKYNGRMGSSSLKYAVDDSHSSVFWKIKY